MLHQQIKDDVKKAMLEKNVLKLNAVRGLLAACTNELIATRRKPNEILKDGEVTTLIRRAVKQRQDSIEQFRLGGRDDLVKQEATELETIRAYLPPELSREAITERVRAKISELKITNKKDTGKLIGAVMKDLNGEADGGAIKKAIEELLT
ncbi:MAG TPA: GatB/YqeY domain-containing protein [Candidatus Paceibacterota bacterium]